MRRLEARLVDSVEVAVIPVLLGGGVPLLPASAESARLRRTGHRLYPKSGIMVLEYAVDYARRVRRMKKRKNGGGPT